MESAQPGPSPDWPSVLQLGLSLLGILFIFTIALFLVLGGLAPAPATPAQGRTVSFLFAADAFLVGVLLVPSAWYALLHLMGRLRPGPVVHSRLVTFLESPPFLLLLAVVAIGLGAGVERYMPGYTWLFLPLLHLFAIGAPVALVLQLGRRGLRAGSQQQEWGIFALGVTLGPTAILFLELGALILAGIIVALILSAQPGFYQEMLSLANRLRTLGNNQQELLRTLEPYLAQPIALFAMLAFVSGIVPLIEEALKPIGAWLLVGQDVTPRRGFAAGLISGAGYALFENLALSVTGTDWAPTVSVRAAAALLHVTTAGISGWALAQAWSRRRYWLLGLTYLGMAFIHGSWNALALASTVSELGLSSLSWLPNTQTVSLVSVILLGVLALIVFLLLIGFNRALRNREAVPPMTV